MDDVEYTGRKSGQREQLGDSPRTERHQLRRLEDHAVAEDNGVRNGPVRHHTRKIERHDRRDDAERNAFRATLHARAHLQYLAGGQLWKGTGELGQFDRLENLGACFSHQLSVLPDDEGAQLIEMLLEQRAIAIEDLNPFTDGKR